MNALRLRLALLLLGLSISIPAQADDWLYTIRPGDQLWSIAQTCCGSARTAAEIARHNNITDPTRIRAGERLRIPTRLLAFAPSTAKVVSARGRVELLRGAATNAPVQAAGAGTNIDMGDSIVTHDGSAVVEFADGSDLAIQANSRVLFNKLTLYGPAGMVDTHLRFAYGRATSNVRPQNRGDRFRIETPEGIAAVRGTQFRVGYFTDEAEDSAFATTETLTGLVSFVRKDDSTDVAAGFGVAASAKGVVRESLLPAPSLIDPPQETTAQDQIRWQDVSGAQSYWVGWAESGSPNILLASKVTNDASIDIDRAPGSYIVSIRGVSKTGIEGFDTQHRLNVLADAPIPIKVISGSAGASRFTWQHADPSEDFILQLTNADTQERNEFATTGQHFDLTLDPGRYHWQIRTDTSVSSDVLPFEVRPDQPSNLQASGDYRSLTIAWDRVANASGYRVKITDPKLEITALETTDTQLIVQSPEFGRYTIEVEATDNAIASESAAEEVLIARRPWWLFASALLLLI